MLRIVVLCCLLAQAAQWPGGAARAQSAGPARDHLGVARERVEIARDLREHAREAARARVPLAVFFSQDGCPYCELARRDYLAPMAGDPAQRGRIRIVEVEVGDATPLADFAGHSVARSAFARAQGVRTVPTVLFFGPRGERVAPPLVGVTVPDFYQSYLDRRIEEALAQLRRP